jgi:hypothetical protein
VGEGRGGETGEEGWRSGCVRRTGGCRVTRGAGRAESMGWVT